MTRSRRAALAAILIAGVVLALVVNRQLWHAATSRVPEASAAELSAGTDSIEQAKVALDSCSQIQGDKIPCYEKHLIPLVDLGGPKLAMGTLMQVANGDRDVRGFGHVYAHAIGIQRPQLA